MAISPGGRERPWPSLPFDLQHEAFRALIQIVAGGAGDEGSTALSPMDHGFSVELKDVIHDLCVTAWVLGLNSVSLTELDNLKGLSCNRHLGTAVTG